MNNPFAPNMNSGLFIIDYPEGMKTDAGSAGCAFSIRELFLVSAQKAEDDNDPKHAAFFRKVADHFPDVTEHGDIVERDRLGNIIHYFDDWDELTDERRIHRCNVHAAIATINRPRFQLEQLEDAYDRCDDVTDARLALAEIEL